MNFNLTFPNYVVFLCSMPVNGVIGQQTLTGVTRNDYTTSQVVFQANSLRWRTGRPTRHPLAVACNRILIMTEDAARVKMYGTFDQYGRALGFYPDDIYLPQEDGSRNAKIPADAVEITLEQWQELLAKQPFAAYVDGEVKVLSAPVQTALVEMEPPQPSRPRH
jgi:hypothetical protein